MAFFYRVIFGEDDGRPGEHSGLLSLRSMTMKETGMTFSAWMARALGIPPLDDNASVTTQCRNSGYQTVIEVIVRYTDTNTRVKFRSDDFTYDKTYIPDTSAVRKIRYGEIIPFWINGKFQLILYDVHNDCTINQFMYRNGLCHAFAQAVSKHDPSYVPQLHIYRAERHVHSVLQKVNVSGKTECYDIAGRITLTSEWEKTDQYLDQITQLPVLEITSPPMASHICTVAQLWLQSPSTGR